MRKGGTVIRAGGSDLPGRASITFGPHAMSGDISISGATYLIQFRFMFRLLHLRVHAPLRLSACDAVSFLLRGSVLGSGKARGLAIERVCAF